MWKAGSSPSALQMKSITGLALREIVDDGSRSRWRCISVGQSAPVEMEKIAGSSPVIAAIFVFFH